MRPTITYLFVVSALGCGGVGASTATVAPEPEAPPQATQNDSIAADARSFVAWFTAQYVPLYAQVSEAFWAAGTDVNDRNTGRRIGADSVYSAFVGSRFVIERTRALLAHRDEIDEVTVRELEKILLAAAEAPGTRPDLVARRVELEARQSEILDGFEFCLRRQGGRCRQTATANDLDEVLLKSSRLDERLRAWEASKEVGEPLGEGILALRDVRNAVAQELGYDDFMSLQVADYGMEREEMMQLLDGLVAETRPLFDQLHCWAKRRLAHKFDQPVPERIPAHWIGNRWGQSWPGLVESADLTDLFEGRQAAWITEQAEHFYVSLGFPELPDTFWERSDLFPVPSGETRNKNSHASAWHMDLGTDVRSLMSVEPNPEWFGTAHHELGHIYYYLSYSHDEVPPLLREGANRAFHEAVGSLIGMVATQPGYLRAVGVLPEGRTMATDEWLLENALSESIVFIPFAAGTMSHFENDLYAGGLTKEQLNERWWRYVREYQGIEPPNARPVGGCDACTKTHINDDPGQYYDYALSVVILHQLHAHICRELVQTPPQDCSYYQNRRVGDYLKNLLSVGATRDWRELIRETTGSELTARPLVEFYAPLTERLTRENSGQSCTR